MAIGRTLRRVLVSCALLLGGCEHGARVQHGTEASPARPATPARAEVEAEATDPSDTNAAPEPAPVARTEPSRPRLGEPEAGQELSVPSGTLIVGSAPGTVGRRARAEADLVPLDMPSFSIDRLPHPNDPDRPVTTGLNRAQARRACVDEGKRLCTELEWERACKDAPDLERRGREWTTTAASRGVGNATLTAVVRGAAADAPDHARRCSARRAAAPDLGARDLGFRCCRGPEAELAYPEVGERSRFRDREMPTSELRQVLASVPELARFAADFVPADAEDATRALARGDHDRTTVNGWEVADHVLRWSPVPGEEAWVITGTGAGSTLLALVYPMPDGSFRHAASYVLENQETSIAVAYTPASRRELLWSACWSCPGEGGAITHMDDARIVVVHR